jgi:hypothetical protein
MEAMNVLEDGAADANIPDVLPVSENLGMLDVVEATLKNPRRLDAVARDEARQIELLPRYLGIALFSYSAFGLAMILIVNALPPSAYPGSPLPMPPARWADGTGLGLLLAYNLGLIGATGICLPTFYFFSLLAGVRLSMLQIVGHVLRGKAATALVLMGILPIYVAVVLGLAVFEAPDEMLSGWLYFGLALPFVAGLEGVHTIYRGVAVMADTLPPERRCRRECFLRRLTLSWAACYTVVSPILIYRLWQLLSA